MNMHHQPDLLNTRPHRTGKILEEIRHTAIHNEAGSRVVPTVSAKDQQWLAELTSLSAKGPSTIIVDLTPGRAAALLSRNPENRKVKDQTVSEIADDIVNSRFDDLNGETLVFSRDGLLNDGQNRCWGRYRSGQSRQDLYRDRGRPR